MITRSDVGTRRTPNGHVKIPPTGRCCLPAPPGHLRVTEVPTRNFRLVKVKIPATPPEPHRGERRPTSGYGDGHGRARQRPRNHPSQAPHPPISNRVHAMSQPESAVADAKARGRKGGAPSQGKESLADLAARYGLKRAI